MHNFNSLKKLKYSYVLVIPSTNWKKKLINSVKGKYLPFFFVKISATDKSLNEKKVLTQLQFLISSFSIFNSLKFCSAHTVQRVQKYDGMGRRFIFSYYLCKCISQNNGWNGFRTSYSVWLKKGFCPKVNFKIMNVQQFYQNRKLI